MAPSPAAPEITTQGPATVVRWHGDRVSLTMALAAGRPIVLDLAALDTLDHDGLALLVRARQQLRQDAGALLCLAAPSRLVLTVLHTMRLESAFPTFTDVPAALAWLAAPDPDDVPVPLWITSPGAERPAGPR